MVSLELSAYPDHHTSASAPLPRIHNVDTTEGRYSYHFVSFLPYYIYSVLHLDLRPPIIMPASDRIPIM